ncbi:hypothetical protein CapIbe_024077 [Capra ibex]
MSDRRKSSAPLSSRTQQRALEDEEEQEREHRRRLWNLRFTTDDEDLPAPESTSMRLPASSVKLGLKVEEYLSAIQRSESVMYANPFHTEFPVAPVDVTSKRNLFEKELLGQSQEDPASSHKENLQLSGVKSRLNLWMSRAQESAQQGPHNQETQRELAAGSKPQWRKKPEAPLGAEVSGGPAVWAALPGERGPAGTHSSTAGLAGGPGGQGTCWLLEAVCCTEDTDPEASLDPETPNPSKCSMFQKISVLEERAVSGKRAVPDKASDSEKRSVSEKATVFEKTPVPEMQLAPGRAMAPVWPQDWEHSASAECTSSPRRQRGTGPEKEPESSAGPLPQAGGLPPVTLQVSSPSTEAEAKSPSPTVALPTFSSSLQRSSPHTISFRMSPRRDSSEAALTRSTSMRLPASSVKLGLKVEQYLSAIQRSESIRYANPFHTEFPVAPVDVTSKRHLFEKEQVGQSQENPASSRKVSSPSTEAEAKSPSPTVALPTFSSSLQRSSPHTISFRMSPRRDSSEAALTRSTSMRLPASSVKLGLKVEQYLSAIQRSESIRYANPFHTEFPVAPVDVTSKRHLFEKEQVGQSQENPASSRKENLQLSGVKSRLNLWMSRAQESAQQGPHNQETQRELAAGSKPQWRKKPEALLGAEKISVLEERAVSGKRAVPDKASDSEKRSVSEKATVFEKTPVPEMQPAPGRAMAPVWPQDWEHSASAECASSPRRQQGTRPEKESESSAGPLPRAGGLPPVTLQVSSPSTEAEAKSPSLVGQSRGPSLQPQGELAALRGGKVTAQPVDEQGPGVSTAGPTEPGDAVGVGSWQESPV